MYAFTIHLAHGGRHKVAGHGLENAKDVDFYRVFDEKGKTKALIKKSEIIFIEVDNNTDVNITAGSDIKEVADRLLEKMENKRREAEMKGR